MPTPNEAIAYAKRFVGNMPIDDSTIKLRLLDDAHKKLWMAAPWSWTVAALEVVQLNNDTQDYDLVGAYADFFGLLHVTMVSAGEQTPNDLAISAALPVTTILTGRPTKVQYVSGTPNKLRFLPVPTGYSTLPTSQTPKVVSIYKKVAAEIDSSAAAAEYSVLGIPDEWFWVYQEIVLLKAFQFTHDPRAGSVTVAPNGIQFTGQYAVVEAGIAEMRRNEEKLFGNLGEVVNG